MLKAFDDLIESRIREARERGDFDDLPGAGRPLPEEDLLGVPQDLRAAYRILKNAGCVPPELEALRELDALIARAGHERGGPGDARRAAAERRLLALRLALEAGGRGAASGALLRHREALLRRLGAHAVGAGGRAPPDEPGR